MNAPTGSAGGSNYTAGATQITVSGGGCSGALSSTTVSGGSITAITVVAGGNNHNSQPSVINKHSCLLK